MFTMVLAVPAGGCGRDAAVGGATGSIMTAPSGSIALVKRGGCSLATVELKAAGCAWRLRGLGPKQWLLGQCRWQSLCRRLSKGQRLNKECVTACPRFEVVHLCMFL